MLATSKATAIITTVNTNVIYKIFLLSLHAQMVAIITPNPNELIYLINLIYGLKHL